MVLYNLIFHLKIYCVKTLSKDLAKEITLLLSMVILIHKDRQTSARIKGTLSEKSMIYS
jgi:hypothetical protein